jgi:glycosyltransferase involved in cell wall biosynthesis
LNEKIKILHIIGTPGLGGVQTYLLDLSKFDKILGLERNLLCLHENFGELKEDFLKNNVNIVSCSIMPKGYHLKPYRFWKLIRRFISLFFIVKLYYKIKKNNPDVIVGDDPNRLNQQLLVSFLLKKPYVWHIHNENQFYNANKKLFSFFLRYYLKNNLFIVSDSKFILHTNLIEYKNKIGKLWKDIPIHHSTSDLSPIFNYKMRNKKQNLNSLIHIGSIGRLAPVKNYQILIEAIFIIKQKYNKNICLSIAGSGIMHKELSSLIKDYNMENYINLLGDVNRKDIPKYLSTLDIYVQTSISEGSPLTIKEAMASALPIVSTNVGGIPELINDGDSGLLIESKNNSALIEALLKLIESKDGLRSELANRAYTHAKKNYSMEVLANKNMKVYKTLYNKNLI